MGINPFSIQALESSPSHFPETTESVIADPSSVQTISVNPSKISQSPMPKFLKIHSAPVKEAELVGQHISPTSPEMSQFGTVEENRMPQ